MWSKWKQALVIVTPETVVRWHRAGFRLYWRWRSRHRDMQGRKRVPKETRELIFLMVAENPTWGAPRIHGELLKLGFKISERTVSRWITKMPTRRQQWLQLTLPKNCSFIIREGYSCAIVTTQMELDLVE
jgi:hypothetical protein